MYIIYKYINIKYINLYIKFLTLRNFIMATQTLFFCKSEVV